MAHQFNFETGIVKRRKVNKTSVLAGIVSSVLLGHGIYTYFTLGFIPLLSKFARQIGLPEFTQIIYLAMALIYLFFIARAIYTLSRKKNLISGWVSFDEKELRIVKGRDKYVIPEEELKELDFELKALPSGDRKKKDQLFGGSYMKIPTKKGVFKCELDINSPEQKEKLLEMIEFLKIEHDVEVKIKESK